MPIYEYACNSFEHRFEAIQRVSEEPLRDCPECGGKALKKLLSVSAPSSRIKGSGWYRPREERRACVLKDPAAPAVQAAG